MTVVDVGADIGYYAVQFAELVGPKGKVIAFEPTSDGRRILAANAILNDYAHLHIHPEALSDRNGVVHFGVSKVKSQMTLAHQEKVTDSSRPETVRMIQFDEWAPQHQVDTVDLVKVDVEGAELLVLSGMSDLLKRCRPILVIEVHPKMMPTFNANHEALFKYLKGFRYDSPDLVYGRIGDNATETYQVICGQSEHP